MIRENEDNSNNNSSQSSISSNLSKEDVEKILQNYYQEHPNKGLIYDNIIKVISDGIKKHLTEMFAVTQHYKNNEEKLMTYLEAIMVQLLIYFSTNNDYNHMFPKTIKISTFLREKVFNGMLDESCPILISNYTTLSKYATNDIVEIYKELFRIILACDRDNLLLFFGLYEQEFGLCKEKPLIFRCKIDEERIIIKQSTAICGIRKVDPSIKIKKYVELNISIKDNKYIIETPEKIKLEHVKEAADEFQDKFKLNKKQQKMYEKVMKNKSKIRDAGNAAKGAKSSIGTDNLDSLKKLAGKRIPN